MLGEREGAGVGSRPGEREGAEGSRREQARTQQEVELPVITV